MAKIIFRKGALERLCDENEIKKKYSKVELNELNKILESDGEEHDNSIKNLEKIAGIKHVRRDDITVLLKVIGGWIGGVATTLLTLKVVALGREYDERGIMNNSSISRPVNQSVLKSIFVKR